LVADAIGKLKPTGITKDIKELGKAFDEVKQRALDSGISLDEWNAMVKAAGEAVVPTGDGVKDAASAVALLDDSFSKVTPQIAETNRETAKLTGTMSEVTVSSDELTGSFEHAGVAAQDVKTKLLDQAKALAQAADDAGAAQRATDNLKASWDALKGSLSDEQQWIDVENGFADVKQAGIDAMDAAKKHTEDADQKARDYQSALITLKEKVIDYAKEVGGLPPEEVTKILAEIDEGSITNANQVLDAIAQARTVIYNAQVAGHREFAVPGSASGRDIPSGEGLTLVGEKGPELISSPGSQVWNADQTAAMLNGGSSTTVQAVNIYVTSMPTPDDVMRLVKKFEQRNGPGWRS